MTKVSTKTLHIISAVIFSSLAIWWIVLHTMSNVSETSLEWFSASYGIMALFGAILGLRISRQWGGAKSLIGKSILLFSLGLFAQEFGQISYSLYTLLFHKEIPYPSIGDVGYFGSVILYASGVVSLGRALAIKFSGKSYRSNLIAVFLPLVILGGSYFVFLRDYSFADTSALVAALDFGYPLGQAIYISLAALVFILSRKYLGGIMRPVILALIFALGIQYAADFMFLYQTRNETWVTGGINDLTYLFSYLVMTTALIRFKAVNDKISLPKNEEAA